MQYDIGQNAVISKELDRNLKEKTIAACEKLSPGTQSRGRFSSLQGTNSMVQALVQEERNI